MRASSPHVGRLLGASFALVSAMALICAPALAQSPPDRGSPAPQRPPQAQLPGPPDKIPEPTNRDRTRGIDFLLGALKVAPTKEAARHVEGRIWALWSRTTSDTTQLLMTRAKTAADAKNYDLSIKLLDSIIKLKPDYVEAWNRRATIYYVQNRYQESLADIREVLTREPRHFAALAGLGMIMQELGDDARALAAYRQALAINPHIERIPDRVKALTEKVEGRDI
jgi:tetratricopeptide (TPR) repeat protein